MKEIFSFSSEKSVSGHLEDQVSLADKVSQSVFTALSGASSSRECIHIKRAFVECPKCGAKVEVTPRYGFIDELPQFNTGDHFRYEELFVCAECGEQIDLMSGSLRIRFIFKDNSESVFRLSFTDYYTLSPLSDYSVGCYLTFTKEFEEWVLLHRE